MEQIASLQQLSDRTPKKKADIFNVTGTSVIYDGSTLTHFLSEQGSRKSLRHVLLLSKVEDAFDLQYGDQLII